MSSVIEECDKKPSCQEVLIWIACYVTNISEVNSGSPDQIRMAVEIEDEVSGVHELVKVTDSNRLKALVQCVEKGMKLIPLPAELKG